MPLPHILIICLFNHYAICSLIAQIQTGQPIDAKTALEWGLAARVFPVDTLVDEAVKKADVIAGHSKIAVAICKQVSLLTYPHTCTRAR